MNGGYGQRTMQGIGGMQPTGMQQTQMPGQYKSPFTGAMDPWIIWMLLQNYNRSAGAGYPEGMTQPLPMGDKMMSLIADQLMPQIMQQYGQMAQPGGGTAFGGIRPPRR